jgi:hypothetical protein
MGTGSPWVDQWHALVVGVGVGEVSVIGSNLRLECGRRQRSQGPFDNGGMTYHSVGRGHGHTTSVAKGQMKH